MQLDQPLKLLAFDADDLAVISAHLQDALLRPADTVWLKGERRFALVVDRLDWRREGIDARRRLASGVHFERVLDVKRSGFDPRSPALATLLCLSFEAADPPAGAVMLRFAGGGIIRLQVECLEAAMADIGPGRL